MDFFIHDIYKYGSVQAFGIQAFVPRAPREFWNGTVIRRSGTVVPELRGTPAVDLGLIHGRFHQSYPLATEPQVWHQRSGLSSPSDSYQIPTNAIHWLQSPKCGTSDPV